MKARHLALFVLLILSLPNKANHERWSAYYKPSLNVIENDLALQRFYIKLDDLLSRKQSKVNIVHIGDSHIQADILTHTTRVKFQNAFGNGGRGFVFPYQIAKSNGPLDLQIRYSGNWVSASIMKDFEGESIGVCGYTLKAEDSSYLFIKASNNPLVSSFNKLTVFQRNGLFLPDNSITAKAVAFGGKGEFPFTTYLFEDYQDSISFVAKSNDSTVVQLQGFNLENTEPGIVYHSVGTNGSSTLHYLRSNSFQQQIKALKADLIIISFGTNDCYLPYSSYCSSCTKERFREIIQRIRMQNPNADILITTPPDHYYRRRYSNRNLEYLNTSLHALALEENCAIWDLYAIMGGRGSIYQWFYAGLARRDLIHFSREGYILQGNLLYDAIIDSYDGRFN